MTLVPEATVPPSFDETRLPPQQGRRSFVSAGAIFIGTVALSGCLDFAAAPAPVVISCDSATQCVADSNCIDIGASLPEVACEVCGPSGEMMSCPFACVDGRCLEAVELAAGSRHACVVLDDGAVWCWGSRLVGALGDGVSLQHSDGPVASAWAGPTDQLVVGRGHACVLSDGQVWCWGQNAFGEVGTTFSPAVVAPHRVVLPLDARALIEPGLGSTSCAVLSDDTVWCWGFQLDGSFLGAAGPDAGIDTPRWREDLVWTEGTDVALGASNGCIATPSDDLVCWGSNLHGALGIGSEAPNSESPQPVPLLEMREVLAVEVGESSACVSLSGGVVWCWGFNRDGESGQPKGEAVPVPTPLLVPPAEAIVELAKGTDHTCGRSLFGRLYCWGARLQGQSGATFDSALHVSTEVPELGSVTAVAAGAKFTCVLSQEDRFVRCFGDNTRGQLGVIGLGGISTGLPRIVGSTVR